MPQLQKISRNNTTNRLNPTTDMREITLHQTIVVAFNEGIIELNSGGWHTPTTRNRMNQVSNEYGLGFQVFQVKGYWFVSYKGQKIAFTDNMTLPR